MARFLASPGYANQLAQGVQALDASAAARGNLLSGQQLKAVNAFGQNIAAQGYGDYTNRLAALANVGQSATQQTAALGAAAAQNAGSALMNAGGAWTTGFQGVGDAINSGFGNYNDWLKASGG